VKAAEELAAEQKTPLCKVSVYLVNSVVKIGDEKTNDAIHYAIAAASVMSKEPSG